MDESSLVSALRAIRASDLLARLSNTQLAPSGFLAVEWLAGVAFGWSTLALRLVPLIGGVASVVLFLCVGLDRLRTPALLFALALFALSDDLIYFASEIKPYSTDVALALACTLAALRVSRFPASRRTCLTLLAVGGVSVWFSLPVAFVLAGLGTTLIAGSALRRDSRSALAFAAVAAGWALSFAVALAVTRRHLGAPGDMLAFWDFGFPPRPFQLASEAAWFSRRSLYLFVNPLDFWRPFSPSLSALPAQAAFLIGGVSLWRRDRTMLAMLVLPVFLVALAAALRLYPFHGRLLLFLVPALLLVVGEGAGRVVEAFDHRFARGAILVAILLVPTLRAAYHLVEPRKLRDFHTHGDRRPAALVPESFPFGITEDRRAMPDDPPINGGRGTPSS